MAGPRARSSGELRHLRSRVAQVLQGLHLVGRLNVLDNVLVGGAARTTSWRTWLRRCEGGLELAPMSEPALTDAIFALGPARYLVDLPGYGFAEAPKAVVEKWQALLRAYLAGRPTLRRVFLLIDARHGVKAVDGEIMALLNRSAVTFQLVLTKADKPRPGELSPTIEQVKAALGQHTAAFPEIVVTSAETGEGIETLRAIIAEMA